MKPIKNTPLIAVFAYRSILLVASMLFLLFVPSKGQNRILINQDPNRPEGFYCVDSTGKEIAYIPQSQQYDQSPYLKILLVPNKTDVDVPGVIKIYNIEHLSVEEIKKCLNYTVKKMPGDSILEKSIRIIVSYNWHYDYRYQNYLVFTYLITFYDENSTGIWVESVINVYDGAGRLVHDFTDYHCIEKLHISNDGKYMLALQYLPMFGDGESGVPLGMLLYDLTDPSCIGSAPNVVGIYQYELVNYEQGVFLFYANMDYDAFNTEDDVFVKFILDPKSRKLYTKKYQMLTKFQDLERLHLKSKAIPSGEDINTYNETLFVKQ